MQGENSDRSMDTLDQVVNRIWEVLNTGIAGSDFTVARIIIVLVALGLLVWMTDRFTAFLANRVLHGRGLDIGVAQAVGAILRYTLIGIGVVVILQSAGINLSALAVLAGALGVGLGFGLQNVTSNFVSGLVILFERPIKVGDRVEVGDVAGDVRKISARATTVVTNDNISIIIPNSEFISEQVTNWGHGGQLVRLMVPVGVSYASDVDQVRDILMQVAGEHEGVLDTPAPDVMFLAFGESSLDFGLRVWTRTYTHIPIVLASELNFLIWHALKRAGVEIPFPQRDLHVRSGVLSVRHEAAPPGS